MFLRSLRYLIQVIFGIVEFMLALRIILKLFGANAGAPFVNWVYDSTASLIQPFVGSFPSPVIERGSVLEFSTLFALIIYAFVGWLLHELLDYISWSIGEHRGKRTVKTASVSHPAPGHTERVETVEHHDHTL